MNKKEFRTADLAVSDGDMKVSGYAAVFESPTVLANIFGEDYKEVIQRGAFEGADMSDVVLRYNHNDSFQILARTSNGTLSLVPDERGLKVEATLANTTAGRDVYDRMALGVGRVHHSADPACCGHLPPAKDERRVQGRQEQDRRDQRGDRILSLGHPHGEGVCQREGRIRQV